MALDLTLLAVIAVAAILGAATGALRQLVQLVAVVLAWVVARYLGADVARGIARTIPAFVSRAAGPAILFLGTFAAASLTGAFLLRASGVARAVRTPVDRALGALLGGAKGALAAWVLLSALALVGRSTPTRMARWARGSDLGALAARHNVLVHLDPSAARALERALEAARRSQRSGALARDSESRRLLADPRVRALGDEGPAADEAEAAGLMEDPEIRALVERLTARERPRRER